jgi:hypothetical protein
MSAANENAVSGLFAANVDHGGFAWRCCDFLAFPGGFGQPWGRMLLRSGFGALILDRSRPEVAAVPVRDVLFLLATLRGEKVLIKVTSVIMAASFLAAKVSHFLDKTVMW